VIEALPRLTPDLAAAVLARALRRGGDFAEVFAEDRSSLSLRLDDGKVEEVSSGVDLGASIRVVKGLVRLHRLSG
jgi:TldD protein